MPATPWRTCSSSDPNGDLVALLSYFSLKSYWRVPSFFYYTAQVAKQLASAQGLLGYSVLTRPLSKRFWTLSAWKDEAALHDFVQHPPHVHIMTALVPHMSRRNSCAGLSKVLNCHWVGTTRCGGLSVVLSKEGASAAT